MFITFEDEPVPANIAVCASLFEKRRMAVFNFLIMAIKGRIQRKGEFKLLVAPQLLDLSGNLSALANRDTEFRLPAGRIDEFAHAGWPDLRHRLTPVM